MGPPQSLSSNKHSGGFTSSLKSSARRITSSISPSKHDDLYALTDRALPGFSTDRSSTSSRSSSHTVSKSRATSASSASLPYLSDSSGFTQSTARPLFPTFTTSPIQKPQTFDGGSPVITRPFTASSATPHASQHYWSASVPMTGTSYTSDSRPGTSKPSTAQSNVSFGQGGNSAAHPPPSLPPAVGGGLQNPHTVYQHIQDMCAKRVSTLDYLRKAHEGRVYWFNTLRFSRTDLAKMPYFEAKKLTRRATNYLLLGLSLPTILELNSSNPLEYLRTLNALLVEFESYQQIHSPDGASSSSLSRARIPQMFKRATQGAGAKGRRTSSATEIGLPMSTSDPVDLKSMTGNVASASATTSSFPIGEQELFPGEEYIHLLTPSLPFDPDFFETFATLCDVLIDCYTRIMTLIPSPAMCGPGVGEIFSKADSRMRKVIISGIVKEFEDASRNGAKTELNAINRVVLGGIV